MNIPGDRFYGKIYINPGKNRGIKRVSINVGKLMDKSLNITKVHSKGYKYGKGKKWENIKIYDEILDTEDYWRPTKTTTQLPVTTIKPAPKSMHSSFYVMSMAEAQTE